MKRLILLGVILIVVGLAMFALNLQGIGLRLLRPGSLFLGALGGALLAGYVYTRWYGFLIPGCILASLWLSTTLAELLPPWPGDLGGAIIIGGLGASFFAIYLVDRFHAGRRRTWPLWAGVGLVLFSIPIALSGLAPEGFVGTLFIAGPGVVLLVIYFWRKAYPFLIPACVLIAVGLVIPAVGAVPGDTLQQGILGAGLIIGATGVAFLAMYVVDKLYTRASNWWPLIPGLVLLVIGGLFGLTGLGMGLTVEQWQALGDAWNKLWPFGLIILGLWLVLRWALRGRRETKEIAPRQDS
jgi:uncharacterized membrane protein YsdA (DUF1294 family)